METNKILIVGAGISGLSLAINLKSFNIPFQIIEKQKHWSKKGLALAIQDEGLTAAANMGILNTIKTHGKPRNLNGIENKKRTSLKQFINNPSDKSFVIPRDILHEELRTKVPNINMGIQISGIKENNDSINVEFNNGNTASFNLIVGADGINSSTRNLIINQKKYKLNRKDIIYSGSVLWGITVEKKYDEIIEVWDRKTMCAMYPVENGTVFSFFRKAPVNFYSPPENRTRDIKKYFSLYFQPVIQEVLEDLPEDIFFDRVRYSRPYVWNNSRITLIGDACHSLSPLSGLGANLAMADAEGLSHIIKKYLDDGNLLNKLNEFNAKRKIPADKAYQLSKMRTKRGMSGFPEILFRNIKMKNSYWEY